MMLNELLNSPLLLGATFCLFLSSLGCLYIGYGCYQYKKRIKTVFGVDDISELDMND